MTFPVRMDLVKGVCFQDVNALAQTNGDTCSSQHDQHVINLPTCISLSAVPHRMYFIIGLLSLDSACRLDNNFGQPEGSSPGYRFLPKPYPTLYSNVSVDIGAQHLRNARAILFLV